MIAKLPFLLWANPCRRVEAFWQIDDGIQAVEVCNTGHIEHFLLESPYAFEIDEGEIGVVENGKIE